MSLDGSVSITVTPTAAVCSGDRCVAVGLPERIAIGSNASGENLCQGRVEEAVYLGDEVFRLHLLIGATRVVAKVPNKDGAVLVEIGQSIPLSWRARGLSGFSAYVYRSGRRTARLAWVGRCERLVGDNLELDLHVEHEAAGKTERTGGSLVK